MNLHPTVIKTNIEVTTTSATFGKRKRSNRGVRPAAWPLFFALGFALVTYLLK